MNIINETLNLHDNHFYKQIKYEINENGCWICKSHSLVLNGYPQIRRYNKKYNMHRYVYEVFNGEIKDGLLVCHICDERTCINPSHMFLGTYKDNHDDMANKNRKPIGEKSSSSKLTEKDVLNIRANKRTLKEIGDEYGIGFGHIGAIKRKECWKHI